MNLFNYQIFLNQ